MPMLYSIVNITFPLFFFAGTVGCAQLKAVGEGGLERAEDIT